jgi:glutamyl-Q tRNA(Asp) synthetase
MTGISNSYVGRFAPSPTGPLHFGSLIAALGSYLDARSNSGKWLLRIDDIDPPREQPDAKDGILRSLEQFGFAWDGTVLSQSTRHAAYLAALARLRDLGLAFFCTCSRKQITEDGDGVYSGTCRWRLAPPVEQEYSIRLRVHADSTGFNDLVQGDYAQNLQHDVGDFVLLRRDGFYSYHLACAIDDAFQDVTHVVRGTDLLDSTPRQIYLQRLLNLTTPAYAHLPVAVNAEGRKLSKQNLARALDAGHRERLLWKALQFLGQRPPTELQTADLKSIWDWALAHWSIGNVPKLQSQLFKED